MQSQLLGFASWIRHFRGDLMMKPFLLLFSLLLMTASTAQGELIGSFTVTATDLGGGIVQFQYTGTGVHTGKSNDWVTPFINSPGGSPVWLGPDGFTTYPLIPSPTDPLRLINQRNGEVQPHGLLVTFGNNDIWWLGRVGNVRWTDLPQAGDLITGTGFATIDLQAALGGNPNYFSILGSAGGPYAVSDPRNWDAVYRYVAAPTVAEVPEPASLALWSLMSVAGLAAWRRRKLANTVTA